MDSMWVRFFWVVGGDNAKIGRFLVLGDLVVGDEEHGVRAGWHVRAVALAEAAEFILARFNPEGTLTALCKF